MTFCFLLWTFSHSSKIRINCSLRVKKKCLAHASIEIFTLMWTVNTPTFYFGQRKNNNLCGCRMYIVYSNGAVLILFDLFLMSSRVHDDPFPLFFFEPQPFDERLKQMDVDSLSFCKATQNQNTKTHAHPSSLSPSKTPPTPLPYLNQITDTHVKGELFYPCTFRKSTKNSRISYAGELVCQSPF